MKTPDTIIVQLADTRVVVHLVKRGKVYHIQYYLRGKQHRESTKFTDLQRAKMRAAELVEAAATIGAVKALTLQAAVDKYLLTRWPAGSEKTETQVDHRNRLNKLARDIGRDINLSVMSDERAGRVFRQYLIDRRAAGDSNRTLINWRGVISRFCRELMGLSSPDGMPLVPWKVNPATDNRLGSVEVQAREPVILTTEEAAAVLKATVGYACYPAVLLCLGGGLRRIECTRMTWGQINFLTGSTQAYAKRRRRFPYISAWALDELRAIKAECKADNDDRVCTCNEDNLNRSLRTACKTAGLKIPKKAFQAMRATFANLLKERVDFRAYARQMGHSLTTAERYYWSKGIIGDRPDVDGITFEPPVVEENKKLS